MIKWLINIFAAVLLVVPAFAQEGAQANAGIQAATQEMVITGINRGKNIYVQNPLSDDGRNYCTEAVYLNNQLVYNNPRASAFTIKLNELPDQSPVEIRIVYASGCMPKVINPTAIRPSAGFRYLALNISESKVFWSTNGAQRAGKFFVERNEQDSWNTVKTVDAKAAYNNYQAEVSHFSGENKYRIRFLQDDGEMYYSKVEEFASKADPITFTPARVSDQIYLSRSTAYIITDINGNELKKGNGKEIDVSDLPTGVYYLVMENRQEKFFKK